MGVCVHVGVSDSHCVCMCSVGDGEQCYEGDEEAVDQGGYP